MDEQSYTKSIKLVRPEDYEPLVGAATVERILRKAEALRNRHVVHVSSTLYGGGVAELLSSLTILMNGAGVQTGWRVIQGRPDFFGITKKFHNALQGGEIDLTESQMEIYEDVVAENAFRTLRGKKKEESRKLLNTIRPEEEICNECGEYSEKIRKDDEVSLCENCSKPQTTVA